MNGFPAKRSILTYMKEFFHPQRDILRFLKLMRKCDYYANGSKNTLLFLFYKIKYSRTSQRLGFSIDYTSFGYGLVIPHYGTIVVGGPNKIGNFAVLHTCTCIAGGGKNIGDGLYLSTGSQIVGNVKIGDNVTVATHSLVLSDCVANTLVAGSPSIVKKEDCQPWYRRDGELYFKRVETVKYLKLKYGI